MRIFVFERPDGSLWADYNQRHRVVQVFEAHARAEIERLIAAPGTQVPERVKALAERALKEIIEKQKPQERPVDARFADVRIGERGFFGRLKWLFTGR